MKITLTKSLTIRKLPLFIAGKFEFLIINSYIYEQKINKKRERGKYIARLEIKSSLLLYPWEVPANSESLILFEHLIR